MPRWLTRKALQQQPHSPLTDAFDIGLDGAEWRIEGLGEIEIVIADDAEVLWQTTPEVTYSAVSTEHITVIAGKQCGDVGMIAAQAR